MKLHVLLFSALLGLMSSAAFAANPAPAAGSNAGPAKSGFCAQNAGECKDLATKFDQWCTENADKCVDAKARMEKHREWCVQNKDKCQKMMERMHKHRGMKQDSDDSDDDDTSSPPA